MKFLSLHPSALLYLYNVYIDFCALLLYIQVLCTCSTKISIFWMRLRCERTKLEPVMSHKTHFVYKWLLVASQNVANNPITISKAFYRKCPEKTGLLIVLQHQNEPCDRFKKQRVEFKIYLKWWKACKKIRSSEFILSCPFIAHS